MVRFLGHTPPFSFCFSLQPLAFSILLNLLSSVLASQPSLPITHCFRLSPFKPALDASSHNALPRSASDRLADLPALNFGPCRFTSRIRCNLVTAPHFKSRFGSKLQYFGTITIVPHGVTFTVNFSNNGLSFHS